MASVYNELPGIFEASKAIKQNDENFWRALSSLLLNYRLQRRFGVALIHKHFNLTDDSEKVVDLRSADGNRIVSSVFRNDAPDRHIVDEFALDIPATPAVVGTLFLAREHAVVPYEYSCVSEEKGREYLQSIEDLDETFLAEWVALLGRNGLSGRLGLAILEDNCLQDEYSIWFERTDINKKVNIVSRESDGESSWLPSMWYAKDNGGFVVLLGCWCGTGYCTVCDGDRERTVDGKCAVCGCMI